MKPAREGRFPVVVWSLGAKLPAIVAVPLITESSPCLSLVSSSGWMIFFAEARGYGGSEGPYPFAAMRADPVGFVQARADDLNVGVEWLKTRPDVNSACITSIGWSQGGAAALLATAKQPRLYRATVADAPGIADTRIPSNDRLEQEVAELLRRPVGRPSHTPVVRYTSFRYRAASWTTARRVVAKVEFRYDELFPRVGFIVTTLAMDSRGGGAVL